MRRKSGPNIGRIVASVLVIGLMVLVGLPRPSSAGPIICGGHTGQCVLGAPYHSPTTNRWSIIPNTPIPFSCATSASNMVTATQSTGHAVADVATAVSGAPCVAGAYFDVGFTTDTWTAIGNDQAWTYWNYTGELVVFLDCAQTSAASFVYAQIIAGINLWDLNTSSWVYGSSNQPQTSNSTAGLGIGYVVVNCLGGGVRYMASACSGSGYGGGCAIVGYWNHLNTQAGHIYQTYSWFMAVDPSGGLKPGDTAFGCAIFDNTNQSSFMRQFPTCPGASYFGISLSSVHMY